MSQELVTLNNGLVDGRLRREALLALNEAAENVDTPQEAREIMLKSSALSDLLTKARAPLDDARLAGKASVVAARRLGRILADTSSKPGHLVGTGRRGRTLSPRGTLREGLGIKQGQVNALVRLAEIPDPQFQRYIQRPDRIPSFNGALRECTGHGVNRPSSTRHPSSWYAFRRRRAGVKTPPNPSLDEGYSLIVRALGHLGGLMGAGVGVGGQGGTGVRDIASAMNLLYEAEDLLRPHRGGYTST